MRRLVVHIGNPKTGSTSLQAWFAAHRRALAAAGIDYPVIGAGADSHRALALALDGSLAPAAAARFVGRLDTILSGTRADTVLLSAEQFQRAPAAAAVPARLAAVAAAHGFRLVAVALVRPQPAYLNSMYTQDVRRLFTARRFDRFVAATIADPRYDYDARFRQWSDAPDIDFVAVPFLATPASLERQFLAAAGLADCDAALGPLPPAGHANPGPGPATVEAFRRIAAASGRARIGAAHEAARRDLEGEAERRGWNRQRFCGLTPVLADRIAARYAAPNAAFARRHWGRDWDAVFAPAAAAAPVANEFDARSAPPALVREIADVAAAVLARHGRAELWHERLVRIAGLGSSR